MTLARARSDEPTATTMAPDLNISSEPIELEMAYSTNGENRNRLLQMPIQTAVGYY